MSTEPKITRAVLAERLAKDHPWYFPNTHQANQALGAVMDELRKVFQNGEALELRGLMTGRVRIRKVVPRGFYKPEATEGVQEHKAVEQKIYLIRVRTDSRE